MKRIVVVVVVAAALLLTACGGGAPAPAAATQAPAKVAATSAPAKAEAAPTAAKAQPQDVSPTEQADATEAPAPTEPAAVAASTDQAGSDNASLQLADEATALKNLKSYKTTWSFEWTGKKQDGTEQTVKWLSAEAFTADPLASYTKFESSDSTQPAQGGTMEFYQIGSKSYMVSETGGKKQCTAFTSEDNKPSGSMLDRNAFGSISSGKLVGAETVNGVKTKHYKYDESATGMKMFAKLTGDVWVAEDGDYVVRDIANWEGALFGLLSGGSTQDVGKGSWKQEVTDINQPFQITPPEGCENAAESLPMMADATETTSFGAMTTYKSASKLADVVKFYQTEMPKAGWKADGEGSVSEGFATLSFTKDGKKASVMLTTEDTTVNVLIQVE